MVRTGGIVAAGHEAVAAAGAEALAAGGNAFDAVVACGFASAVAEPGFTSLAGGGFLLARTGAGDCTLLDFFVDTPGRGLSPAERTPAFDEVVVRFPAAEQRFHCGLGSVAVPGCLPGYLEAHRRLGRLDLAEVVAPAVRLAGGGVEVSSSQSEDFLLLAPIFERTDAARALFFPHGTLLRAGDVMRNQDLAGFMAAVGADPTTGFGSGPAHDALVDQMVRGHGLVTAADLTSYRVTEREPLAVPFAGHRVLTNPGPSFGGRLIGLALDLLAEAGPLPAAGSPALATTLARVMAEVDRRRDEVRDDPTRPTSVRGTTHVSVADDEGNVASMTTSNGECSGDVVPGTGVMLNNMLGEDDLHPDGFHAGQPGRRVASMMAPSAVLDDRGRVVLVLGSGGSKRIRSAIVQVLVAHLVHGSGLADAVRAPRIHWDTDHVEVEPGLAPEVLAALAALAPVNVWPAPSLYFGGVHAVVPGSVGVGDARRGGAVRVVSRR